MKIVAACLSPESEYMSYGGGGAEVVDSCCAVYLVAAIFCEYSFLYAGVYCSTQQ